ncbi:hypothetical protein [Candidatus Amarolinea dominans]|uniref:hypothetical protein n=1 Tax=Candidatus Amarolinea dominans TaxID=3140696 RepID=UPI0031CC485B
MARQPGQTYTADALAAGTQHQARILRAQRRRHDRVQLKRIGNRSPIQPQISLAPAGSGQFTVTGSNWPTTTSSRSRATTPGLPTPGGITTLAGAAVPGAAPAGVEVSLLRLQTVPVSGQSAIAYRFELGKVMTDSNGRLRATYPIPPGVPEALHRSPAAARLKSKPRSPSSPCNPARPSSRNRA